MLKSFIPVEETSHFPIQNLPYCVFSTPENAQHRVGVRIGDFILDLHLLDEFGFFSYHLGAQSVFAEASLNRFMGIGRPAWQEARAVIQNILRAENPTLQDPDFRSLVLHPVETVTLYLPVEIGDYTDFYASRDHAANVGEMFRGKDNALLPNWLHLPVGYHGRSSSVILSGSDVHRPRGQVRQPGWEQPRHIPSQELDFELEIGYFVGPGSELGKPLDIRQARDHIFGMVLLNDWSARDIQRWEYQPLGPFLAKNFATSISPWVVTLDALDPFRVPSPEQLPQPLPYLREDQPAGFDIRLEVSIRTERMASPEPISRTNAKYLYWSITQQLAHHTATGCNLRPGDLMGTGTISGPGSDACGSMLELAWGGERPLEFAGGETRAFLEDGDRITFSGFCQGDGYRVGFGELTACVLPAPETEA